jgi:hypothetical protein
MGHVARVGKQEMHTYNPLVENSLGNRTLRRRSRKIGTRLNIEMYLKINI